jgi:hypothetical protein
MTKIIPAIVILTILLLANAPAASAQSLAGDWQGALNPQFTIALHVVAKGNTYTATADNPKLGFIKVPAKLTVAGSSVSFTTSGLVAPTSFNGTWDGNNTITGTFTQPSGTTPLTLTRTSSPPSAPPASSTPPAPAKPSVAGTWKGNISPQLPMVLHIVASGTGYTATADTPGLAFIKVPVTITVNQHRVTFHVAIPGSPGDFTGRWRGNTMTGTFLRGTTSTPMTLTR